MVAEAVKAREILRQQGVSAQVINAGSVAPGRGLIRELSEKGMPYYVLEEQVLAGAWAAPSRNTA